MNNIRKRIAALLASGILLTGSTALPAAAKTPYTYTVLEDGTISVVWEDKTVVTVEIPTEIDGYTVTELGENCFRDCTALKTVVIPEGILSIQDYAFSGCSSVETLEIPVSVSSIGSFVFEDCPALQGIYVENDSAYFCDEDGVLFDEEKHMLIRYPSAKGGLYYTVPESCVLLAPWSFTGAASLKKVILRNVQSMGADSFFGCSSLETISIPEGVTELVGAQFAYCTSLKEITLPESLRKIGDKCFYGCVSVEEMTLPVHLNSIGEKAFYGCINLNTLKVPAAVRTLGNMSIGYSVNPDTGKDTLIPEFTMQTYNGSAAKKYAEKNGISCQSFMRKSMALFSLFLILSVIAAAIAGFLYYSRKQEEKAAAEQKKQEEKRKRKEERKNKKR